MSAMSRRVKLDEGHVCRYGGTGAFLTPMYGTSEVAQAFCRCHSWSSCTDRGAVSMPCMEGLHGPRWTNLARELRCCRLLAPGCPAWRASLPQCCTS